MLILNSKKNKQDRGFTLIEMIVALGIFTLVAVVAIGALLKIVDANKKSQSLKTAVNNLNFAIESMTRELRVGYGYYCADASSIVSRNYTPGNCTNQSLIAFRSSKLGTGNVVSECNLIHAYRYNSAQNTIEKAEQANCDQNIPSAASPFIPVVSRELNVELLTFSANAQETGSILGGGQPNALQAWARIIVKASAGTKASDKVDYMLNSFVSQRVIR